MVMKLHSGLKDCCFCVECIARMALNDNKLPFCFLSGLFGSGWFNIVRLLSSLQVV